MTIAQRKKVKERASTDLPADPAAQLLGLTWGERAVRIGNRAYAVASVFLDHYGAAGVQARGRVLATRICDEWFRSGAGGELVSAENACTQEQTDVLNSLPELGR